MMYQISSGQGPAECELGVAKLLAYLQGHHAVEVCGTSAGRYSDTYRSVRFFSEDDLSAYLGSVQWICQSPFRPQHRRKNWFLDFSVCAMPVPSRFDPFQVRFETFRSSGAGGQNVNKVESGVRALYPPLGIAVECTEERSQHANKEKATKRLRQIVDNLNEQAEAAAHNDNWRQHTNIQRGGAVAVFTGPEFRPRPRA